MPVPSELIGERGEASPRGDASPQPVAGLWEGLQEFAVLPGWLTAARDPQTVCRALLDRVLEFSSGQLSLEDC